MNQDILLQIKPKFNFWVRFFGYNIYLAFIAAIIASGVQPIFFANELSLIMFISIDAATFIITLIIAIFFDNMNYLATSYRVYADRIEFDEGFLNHKHTSIKLKDIKEIHFNQNFVQLMAKLGTVKFITAANGGYSSSAFDTGVSFSDIENPAKVYDKVREIHEKAE